MEFSQTKIISNQLKKFVTDKALTEAEAKAFYQKHNLSPSMDFLCMRKGYFNLLYTGGTHLKVEPDDVSYENERAKIVGNNLHDYLQTKFQEMGILRLNEKTLEDTENKIKARLDSVIEINNQLILVELKSAKSYSLHKMNEEASPDIEHIKQIQLYFYLLELNKNDPEIANVLQGRTITNGIIMYESKNDHKIMEFLVHKDDELIRQLLKYTRILWKNFNNRTEPKVQFEPNSSECLYKCSKNYYEMCHGKPKPVKTPEDKNIWGYAEAQVSKKDPSFR